MPLQTEKRGRHRSTSGRPVFLDSSGRRLRQLRVAGLITLTGVVAYVGLVASAFLGVPNIIGPLLPESMAKEATIQTPPVPAEPAASETPSAPTPISSTPPAPAPVSTATPSPTASPSDSPSPSPSPSASASASSVPAVSPGRSAEAPGQANRPPTP